MTYLELLMLLQELKEKQPEVLNQRVHVISGGELEFHSQLSLGLGDNALSFIPDYSGERDDSKVDAA